MTASLYRIERGSARLSVEALESFHQCTIAGVSHGITSSISARILSLTALARGGLSTLRAPRTLYRAFAAIVTDEVAPRSVVRIAITVGLVVLLSIYRPVVSILGVVSPEITYSYLRMHKHLLILGLFCKAQSYPFHTKNPQLVEEIGDQSLRVQLVRTAIRRLTEPSGLTKRVCRPFSQTVWKLSAMSLLKAKDRQIV